MLQALISLLTREWILMSRSKGQWAEPWVFLILVACLIPMLNQATLELVPILGISLVWLSVLLSVLLTFDKTLRADFMDGVFEHWLLGPNPLWWLLMIKSFAHWVFWILPMILMTPILLLMMQVPFEYFSVTMLTLILGTPVFSFVGGVAAALTLTIRSSGLLLALIFIPLCVPVLLLALSASASASFGETVIGHMALLSALSILSMVLLPHASAFGIKVSMS